ncbi:efflux RND transporter permease subunit [Stieleria sp. ICT_E10.1]|uniref:efflux RND transporter permease subunit n=1 Tax=Stieleria sedimenti TaxID=2976331 RepID=UPI00217FCA12|nr:efflux RND transporter permease subunit [Stieleria sedimenti]MCS7467857.1 efflux RND transporter permease subunit [Stieleria sedimenti]
MTRVTQTTGMAARLFFWWADHPAAQLAVFVAMSTLATIGFTNPALITERFPETVQQVDASGATNRSDRRNMDDASGGRVRDNVQPFQVGGGQCVLVARVDPSGEADLFTGSHLRAMRRVAEGLQSMPQIDNVMWLDSVPGFNLFGLSGTLLPSDNASQRQLNEARSRVLENPLAVGQLISQDGRTVLMHLGIDWFFVTSDEAVTSEIRERAASIAATLPGVALEFQLTGPVPLHLMMANNHVTDSTKYQLIGYSIMLLSAVILFRGFSAVMIVAVSPAVGVLWTTGMLHFLDLQDNPFNDIIVPVLVSLVGLTDSVHLMVEIRQQRASGLEVNEAARRGISRVGMACLLTSTTTAIGFLSLLWAHHEIVRDFGLCCVVGVAMTFISVLTVIPLGCRSPLGRRLHVGLGKSLVDGQLRRIGPLVDWVLRRDRAVARIAIAVTFAMALISLQLQPDEKRYSGLSESGEAAQALRHLDRSLGGLEFSTVDVRWFHDSDESELLDVLGEIDALLASEPLIGNPLGVGQLLAALPGDGDAEERMTLLELLPPSLKRAFYVPERRFASVQFRVQDLGIAAYSEPFQRIEAGLNSIGQRHPNFDLALEGSAVWRWRNIYQIVTDLATSLGTASVIIWLVLTLVYRSIRIGLISIIPNLFPLAATATVLVVSGQHLEMVTVCVFTICVGIAVDDTIHFLTRYQEEMKLGGPHQEVIRRAFTGVGSALLMTTIVLVAGLGSAIAGDSRDARLFGIMGCLTLATALFADVLLLPAMLSRFARSKDKVG